MEETKSKSGQNLGIAALITAIVTFVFAVIPCVGLIAIIPGIIAIILASVGLSNANRADSPRGVLVAGLIIGIVASMISISQFLVIGKFTDKWPNKIEEIVNDVQKNVIDELEDASVSIKVQNGEDVVEINVDKDKKNLEQTLEELEEGKSSENDTIDATD
jgi:phosphate/sulfate permease